MANTTNKSYSTSRTTLFFTPSFLTHCLYASIILLSFPSMSMGSETKKIVKRWELTTNWGVLSCTQFEDTTRNTQVLSGNDASIPIKLHCISKSLLRVDNSASAAGVEAEIVTIREDKDCPRVLGCPDKSFYIPLEYGSDTSKWMFPSNMSTMDVIEKMMEVEYKNIIDSFNLGMNDKSMNFNQIHMYVIITGISIVAFVAFVIVVGFIACIVAAKKKTQTTLADDFKNSLPQSIYRPGVSAPLHISGGGGSGIGGGFAMSEGTTSHWSSSRKFSPVPLDDGIPMSQMSC